MPFTPFHLGPGALFKALGGDRFSFTIFAGSQILMDAEPLVRMIRGDAVVHGISHTISGALVVALVAAAVGPASGNAAIRIAGLVVPPIGWRVALFSALVGTYSHIALDAVMHADMRPLWPIADGNLLLHLISVEALHLLCMMSGLLGGGLLAARALRDV
ncbi:metal-dependent hydrolase [Sphingomonas crusticola]|uniref:metal-dependent hydrolase n=1 Tax=Sphingomonas crusticola TaxID=1697973 RepID=UPI000E22F426|nr:metal-dependent hydrolase [Sphingomonas crusticola]